LVRALGIEKAVIDRTDRLIPLTCMEVEDDDEDENDWGRKEAGKATPPSISRGPPKSRFRLRKSRHLNPAKKL
jgi:hypothetical protein